MPNQTIFQVGDRVRVVLAGGSLVKDEVYTIQTADMIPDPNGLIKQPLNSKLLPQTYLQAAGHPQRLSLKEQPGIFSGVWFEKVT